MKSLSKRQLNFAGWLSIALAIITVPYVVVSLILAFAINPNGGFNPLNTLMSVSLTAAFVYLYFFLKNFLNQKFKFHNADKYLWRLIFLQIVITAITELSTIFNNSECIACGLTILLLIPFGIILIMLGIKLLSLKNDLYGLLKPFCYQTIATGVLMSSIILFPLAIIPSIISYVILGIILLRSASENHV